MRPLLPLLLPLVLSACSTTGAVHLQAGQYLQEEAFELKEDEGREALGGEVVLDVLDGGLSLEGGVLVTSADISDLESNEYYLGLRGTFRQQTDVRPYVGVGMSLIDTEGGDLVESQTDLGLYARTGVGYHMGAFVVGFDLRTLFGAPDQGYDFDYNLASVFVGVSF